MRRRAALLALLCAIGSASTTTAVAPHDEGMLYILPLWNGVTDDLAGNAAQLQLLRSRIGEGGPVRVGFTSFLVVDMTSWTVTTEAEALAALAGTVQRLDAAIARARAGGFPIALSLFTALRDGKDAAQAASQAEDRRVMQWYDGQQLADGWWSLSRYARQQYRVRELYMRALGRVLANRIALNPGTIVAVSGDAEVELAFEGTGTIETPPVPTRFADYSPFSVAEFRDWLRGEGLYAPGHPFAADAYAHAARYRGDPSPAADAGGGATLNGDFGTTFTTWNLCYEDWTLADPVGPADPRAIPEGAFAVPGWLPAISHAAGFDPPRDTTAPPTAWSSVWFQFRQSQVWRHNQDFARWLTTSADPATGLTIPPSRWYSYQIPADYIFGHSPSSPDLRYLTSASSWSTADVRPFGGAGITSFNTYDGTAHYRTLASVAPLLAGLNTRWAILEWNPSVPSVDDPAIYREEMGLVERHRPTLLVPYSWQDPAYRVLNSGFELALSEMVGRMRNAPWNLRSEATGTSVRLTWAAPELGTAPQGYVLEVGSAPGLTNILSLDTASRSTVFEAVGAPGTYFVRARARRGGILSPPSNDTRVDSQRRAAAAIRAIVADGHRHREHADLQLARAVRRAAADRLRD